LIPLAVEGIAPLLDRLEREEFDLVAIGRTLLTNPLWPDMVRRGAMGELLPFRMDALRSLH
jgi:2,4-dienoyl-CoA reductase-like NADH-dependent reductase (Old Yellow Enzyme family)